MLRTWLRSPLFWTAIFTVFVGVFLRLQFFGQTPVSLYWDEMAVWNDALSIAQTGRDTHNRVWNQAIFISYGDFKMPLYIWLTSLVTHFTSNPLMGARVVSLLAGLSLLASMPWLAFEVARSFGFSLLERKYFAQWSVILIALAPVALHFSRVGFEAHLGLALLVLSVAAWLRGLSSTHWLGRVSWLTLGSILGATATYAYFSVRFVWPGLAVIIATVGAWKLSSWKKSLQIFALSIVGVLLWGALLTPLYTADFSADSSRFRLSTPSILNDETTTHQANQWRLLTGNSVISRVIFSTRSLQAMQLWENELQFTRFDFLFISGDQNLRHGTSTTGILWWWMAPFFAVGVFAMARRYRSLAAVLGVWWALGVLPAAVPNDVPHALRSLNALPALILFTAYGGASLWEWLLEQKRYKSLLVWAVTLGRLGVIILTALQWSGSQVLYAERSQKEWQNGYSQLAEYVSQVHAEYPVVWVDRFDDRFFVYYQPVSGLSWSEIQQMPTQGFKRTQFENITLEVSQPLQTAMPGTLVILKGGADVPDGYEVKQRIMNQFGEEVFLAVEVPQV